MMRTKKYLISVGQMKFSSDLGMKERTRIKKVFSTFNPRYGLIFRQNKKYQIMGNVVQAVLVKPIEYLAKTGSEETFQTGRQNTGGQIAQINTINIINDTTTVTKEQFDAHLRSKGINEDGIKFFSCLKWIDVGSRQKKEYFHFSDQTTCQKIGIAIRRVNEIELKTSIIWKRSSVRVNTAKTIIYKTTHNFGPGFRTSDHNSETILRGLDPNELKRVQQALEAEMNNHHPQMEALNNV